jgi:hypothetical protein
MRHEAICSNLQVMPKRFTWKKRHGFSNGLGSSHNLLAEPKEIQKKSQIITRRAAIIMNEGHWPILEKEFLVIHQLVKNQQRILSLLATSLGLGNPFLRDS